MLLVLVGFGQVYMLCYVRYVLYTTAVYHLLCRIRLQGLRIRATVQ